jgi:hypothetical protein
MAPDRNIRFAIMTTDMKCSLIGWLKRVGLRWWRFRFVRRECLDHLLIFSDAQLLRVVKEYVGYFNRARPRHWIAQ